MQIVAYPPLVMAAIKIFVGLFYLYLFLRRRQPMGHLLFALLCLSVAAYDLFSVGLYSSHSTAEGAFWQRLQLDSMDFISIFLVWFVTLFSTRKGRRVALVLTVWFIGVLVASVFLGPELTVSPLRPATKTLLVFGMLPVTYYEGTIGGFFTAAIGSAILAYVYLLGLLSFHYRRTRDKSSLLIIAALLAYFVGVINDFAVAARVYSFIYVSEYAFMVLVFAMSFVLLNEFVSLNEAVEEANRDLEKKVRERTKAIEELSEELRRQAELDSLTGIYNRRFFGEYLEIELRRARSRLEHRTTIAPGTNDMNFGLAMIDVDHFKRVNDTYGHPAGDRVLVELVRRIRATIFSRDIFCRFGGEEFIVLFTRTSREGIENAVEKIRKSVEDQCFDVKEAPEPLQITVSLGAAIFEDVANLTSEEILRLADDRLLTAKKSGRNRVVYR
jgi:diguanylate cyclase (GGDEF)-like protein